MTGILFQLLIPTVVMILIVIVIAGVAVGKKNGGDNVIRNVYMYVVLFATLMMTIGGSVGVVMNLADILAPPAYYQTYDDYTRMYEMNPKLQDPDGATETETLTEEELRQRYDDAVALYQDQQVSRAKNNMIKSFAWIIVPLPIFLAFRRMIEKQTRNT